MKKADLQPQARHGILRGLFFTGSLSALALLVGGGCGAELGELDQEGCEVAGTCLDGGVGIPGTEPLGNGHTGTGGADGSGTGGATAGSGGFASGTGGVSGGTGGGSAVTCTNVPPDARETCDTWAEWGECGADWMANFCDESCGRCTVVDPGTGGTSGGTGGSGGGTATLPDINGGQNGWASRYWDCCKPHCAWPNNGGTADSCSSNGTSTVGDDTASACGGGSAYVCNSEAPRAISSTVAYGHVAVPNPSCGQCFHIQFTGASHNAGADPGSAALAGKHMIVRVSNTGGDVQGGQFDLMVPGGGVGLNPNTCPTQWGTSSGNMGATYGGFLTNCSGSHSQRKECVRQRCNTVVPAGELRDSCNWFVDWYEVADNPAFKYEPIACPSDI